MSDSKPRPKPKRPMKLLRALHKAQMHVMENGLEVEAATIKEEQTNMAVVRTAYASADDVIRLGRKVLLEHGIMASCSGSTISPPREEGGRFVMTLHVHLMHVPSGQEQLREYQILIDSYGSNAAAMSGFATALRLVLLLPKAKQRVEVSGEAPPPSEPIPTQRRVIPAPIASDVHAACGTGLEALKGRVRAALIKITAQTDKTVRDLRQEAKLPVQGELSLAELSVFEAHLHSLFRPPGELGEQPEFPDKDIEDPPPG